MSFHVDPAKALQSACLDMNGMNFQWAQRDEKPQTGIAIPDGAKMVEFGHLYQHHKHIPYLPGMEMHAKGADAPNHPSKLGAFDVAEDGRAKVGAAETQTDKNKRLAANAAHSASYDNDSDRSFGNAKLASAANLHMRL